MNIYALTKVKWVFFTKGKVSMVMIVMVFINILSFDSKK